MSFPTPRQFGGRTIRTPDLGNRTVVPVRNKHLVRQDARRKVVCIGARRKACCMLRNSHFPLRSRTNSFTLLISHAPYAWQSLEDPLSHFMLRGIREFRSVRHFGLYSIFGASYIQSVRRAVCVP